MKYNNGVIKNRMTVNEIENDILKKFNIGLVRRSRNFYMPSNLKNDGYICHEESYCLTKIGDFYFDKAFEIYHDGICIGSSAIKIVDDYDDKFDKDKCTIELLPTKVVRISIKNDNDTINVIDITIKDLTYSETANRIIYLADDNCKAFVSFYKVSKDGGRFNIRYFVLYDSTEQPDTKIVYEVREDTDEHKVYKTTYYISDNGRLVTTYEDETTY